MEKNSTHHTSFLTIFVGELAAERKLAHNTLFYINALTYQLTACFSVILSGTFRPATIKSNSLSIALPF